MKELQNNIRHRREELGLSLKELADAIGVSEATMSRYETSDSPNLTVVQLLKLAEIININPAELFDHPPTPEASTSEKMDVLIRDVPKATVAELDRQYVDAGYSNRTALIISILNEFSVQGHRKYFDRLRRPLREVLQALHSEQEHENNDELMEYIYVLYTEMQEVNRKLDSLGGDFKMGSMLHPMSPGQGLRRPNSFSS